MRLELALFLMGILVLSAWLDVKSGKIPNIITLSSLAVLLTYSFVMNGFSGLVFSLQGAGIGFVFLFIPFLFRVMGAGDVKLMTALGAGLGPVHTFYAVLIASLAGGVYAMLVLFHHNKFRHFFQRLYEGIVFWRTTGALDFSSVTATDLPKLNYGIVIAIGGLASVFHLLIVG